MAEIDREMRPRATEFALDHPGYVLEAVRLNVLRMLDRANDPAFESIWDQELAIPRRLRGATTASFYLVLVLAFAVLAAAAAGRLSRPVGPFWLWLVPLLTFLSVIPLSGKPRYRAPIDPFLVLLAALALAAAYELWLATRPDRRPSRRDPASARS